MFVGLFSQLVGVMLNLLQTVLEFTVVLSGPQLVHHGLYLSSVLCDPLDVGAAGLYEAVEVPRDGAIRLCFSVRHVCWRVLKGQTLAADTHRRKVFVIKHDVFQDLPT